MLKEQHGKLLFMVKIVPKSSKNEIIGWEGDILKIKLRAVPEKGKANEALIAFLADKLGTSKASITIISGHTASLKRISLSNISFFDCQNMLKMVKI
jgi:uncharacterized protein